MSREEKVINLFEKKEDPVISGTCFCMACKSEWEAIIPVGVTTVECPTCSAMKGKMKYEVVKNESHWECNCGNSFFNLTPTCIYCPNCGAEQDPYS